MPNGLKKVHFAAVGREIHIDVPLSNVALDYRPAEMIADLIAPIVPVPNISGQIPEFNREDKMRNEDSLRAPGTAANEVSRDVSSQAFFCNNYALSYPVTIEDKSNSDPIYVQKLFNGAAEYLKGKLMLGMEIRVGAQVTNTSNVGSSSAVASGWTDYTNSDPMGDVNTRLDSMEDATGTRPNKIVFGNEAWRSIRRNTTILNRIYGNNNGGGFATTAEIAALFEVEKVLVGRAYQNTGAEGQAEALSTIWGDNVLVCYTPLRASIMEPSFMYGFRWTTGGIPNMQVERHPYNTIRKVELTELGYYQDERITGSDLGQLLTAVNSST